MTDRELLEAAYAAYRPGENYTRLVNDAGSDYWNPLTDDADAFRLAVRLRLHAKQFLMLDDRFDVPLGMVEVWRVDDDDPLHVEFLRRGDDRLVATRRAIVRAAAEIGKGMK
jgi:hypothetical protein